MSSKVDLGKLFVVDLKPSQIDTSECLADLNVLFITARLDLRDFLVT